MEERIRECEREGHDDEREKGEKEEWLLLTCYSGRLCQRGIGWSPMTHIRPPRTLPVECQWYRQLVCSSKDEASTGLRGDDSKWGSRAGARRGVERGGVAWVGAESLGALGATLSITLSSTQELLSKTLL